MKKILFKQNKGSILVFSIWVLVFLSFLNVALYKMVSSRIAVTKRLRKQIISPYMARAVYHYVRMDRQQDSAEYHSLYKLSSSAELVLGKATSTYMLVDEERKININKVSKEILSRLPGLNDNLADKIMESELLPFHVKEELLAVDGIDEEIYAEVKDFITVYGIGGVNINTAGDEVFTALGFDSDFIDVIRLYRAGEDGEESTEDDRVFKSRDMIISDLQGFYTLFFEQEDLLVQLMSKNLLTVSASEFSLEIDIQIANKPAAEYTIVLGSDNEIKQWQEH